MGGSAAGAMEHSAAMHAAASPAPPPPAAPSAVPSAAKEESTSAAKEADPSGADGVPSQQMTRRDRIRRALKEEAGIADGRLPGAYKDEKDGHAGCPWRSGIRRDGFKDVKGGRHPSYADDALRILEVYQAHPPYVATGRFTLAPGKHVNKEQLARLVGAARADAGR